LLDWREAEEHRERFDLIWASGVMYESEAAKPLAVFLSTALKKGGRAWIAEPGRSIFLEFTRLLPQYGMNERRLCSLPVFPLTSQKVPVTVTLWELSLSV
jgi:predicted nicotinamide N-methyase